MLGNSRDFKPELFVQSIFMLLLCLISWEILFTMNKNVSLEWKRAPMILSLTRGRGGGSQMNMTGMIVEIVEKHP